MIITLKKKFTSGVAIVCALMILIGILPTNIFGRSNTADAAGNMTVYLDVKYGTYKPWQGCTQVWIHTFNDSKSHEMEKVSDGLFKYTLAEGEGLLFRSDDKDWADYKKTVDIYDANDGDCYYITNFDGIKQVAKRPDFTPPTTSLAGNTIYVKDMVGDATAVTVKFYASERTSAASYPNTILLTTQSNHLFSTKIPADSNGKPYDTVEISYTTDGGTYSNSVKYGMMGEGNKISDSYFNYDESNCNTYYIRAYGDDEETERKNSCYWERPLKATSLYSGVNTGTGARRLYFNSDFDGANATIEFGYGGNKVSETNLQHDETAKMYYYEITSTSLTQEDLITVKVGGKTYRMFWFDMNSNIATVTTLNKPDNGTAAFVSDLYRAGFKRIYFDATLSKLSYAGDTTAGTTSGMGASEMYCSYGTASAGTTTSTPMKKAEPHGDGKNTWNDVYYIDIQDTYKYIRFGAASGSTSSYGSKTDSLQIPALEKPCFYADSSDNVIYDGGMRGGYWGEVYTIRDAETGKSKDVVDIKQSTFEKKSDRMYVNSTFYDYYSDYELNGNNRDNYPDNLPAGSSSYNYEKLYRHWNIYRQFDQALSDYYKTECPNTLDPLYEGHIQPAIKDWGRTFSTIAGSLDLFYGKGLSIGNRFYANNNSAIDYNGKGYAHELDTSYPTSRDWSAVVQGLTETKLSDGNLLMKNTDALLPFFNESFLLWDNSKNAKLGEIYKNVSFPFEKYIPTRDEDNNGVNDGVEYWHYNANEKTLAMRQDSTTDEYYLHEYSTTQPWSINKDSSSGDQAKYGFFPFNEPSSGSSSKNATKYNYGYGMKLEFNFRLTSDGQVLGTDGNKHPIMFRFSGDDDVWVYIDGNLALDLGGAHGESEGIINFANNTAAVGAVKASPLSTGSAHTGYVNSNILHPTTTTSITLDGESNSGGAVKHSETTEHTLVMYYMERGQWESNLSVEFNFPDNNELDVKKVVDYSNVNNMFQKYFETNSNFAFLIQNYATHYATKDVDMRTLGTAETFASTFDNFVKPTDTNTKAKVDTVEGTKLIHWSSTTENADRTQTASRLVTIYPDSSSSVDASNCEYMRFNIAVPKSSGGSETDALALSKMYIRFTDSRGKTAYGYLTASRLMGVPDVDTEKFNTVRVLLDELNKDEGFDSSQIASIGFQYDDPAEIYISDFVFQSKPNLTESTGFVTNQYEIPDYGSVENKGLTNVTGAVYTVGDNRRVVGEDSQFFLKNNETATFTDQFRRGSYIYLNEELTKAQQALFSTTYTVYEDGKKVDHFVNTNNVTNDPSIDSLVKVSDTKVDDGRTEAHVTGDVDGHAENNSGYTYPHRPTDGGFVFRSYLTNESGTSSLTKLQVVYTNTAKVGDLVIAKDKATGSNNLDADYTFYVEFYNVGDVALEDDTIIAGPFTLKSGGDPCTELTGIPVGTQFTIHEVQPSDGSSLKEVERLTNGSSSTSVKIKNDTITVKGVTYNTRSVSGTIGDEDGATYKYKMLNYKYTVMIEIQKNWENRENYKGAEITEVKFHLQRREKGQTDDDWKNVTDISGDPVVITVNKDAASGTGAWTNRSGPYAFYVGNNSSNPVYEYRVVELNPDNSEVTNGIYNGNFTVKYDPEYTDGGDGNDPPVNNTLKFNVTNTYVETTEYNAVKEWYDETGAALTAPAAGTQLTLKLQSTTRDTPNDVDWTDVSGKTVTVKFDGTDLTLDPSADDVTCDFAEGSDPAHSKWKVTFSNLPAKDSDGTTSLHYRVIEASAPSGYEQMVSDYSNDEAAKTSTIKNKKVTTADYKVTKQWPDGLPQYNSEITLQLQQTTVESLTDSDWEPADSVTDNTIVIRYESNGNITVKKTDGSNFTTDPNLTTGTGSGGVDEWYYQWTDLPTKDSNGQTIKYRVVETEVCDGYFTASQTHNATGSVIVNKKVVNMPSAGSFPFIFNFALFGGIVIAISLVTLHLNKKFNIFQRLLRIIRNVKGV